MPYPPGPLVNDTVAGDGTGSQIRAEHITDIVTELGANPSGTVATVQARFEALDTQLAALTARVAALEAPGEPPGTPGTPKVLFTAARLAFMRSKVVASENPWRRDFDALLARSLMNRTGTPYATIDSQTASGAFISDAQAALMQALSWYCNPDRTAADTHALRAIGIINKWADPDTGCTFMKSDDGGQTGNLKIQIGWATTNMCQAAEILRYTYPAHPEVAAGSGSWTAADIGQFENWLRTVILRPASSLDSPGPNASSNFRAYPLLEWPWDALNWAFCFTEAKAAAYTFLRDGLGLDSTAAQFKARMAPNIYQDAKGAASNNPATSGDIHPQLGAGFPVPKSSNLDTAVEMADNWWVDAPLKDTFTAYVNGLTSESFRDVDHLAMGFGSLQGTCEIFRTSGHAEDLWAWADTRIRAAYEWHAGWINEFLDQCVATNQTMNQVGNDPGTFQPAGGWRYQAPAYPAGDNFMSIGNGSTCMGWEGAYRHLVVRQGYWLPQLERLVRRIRAGQNNLTTVGGWGTNDTGNGGVPIPGNHMMYEALRYADPNPTELARDEFSRTVAAGGWGSAPTGGAWTVAAPAGSVNDFSVDGTNGRGLIAHPAVSRFHLAALTSVTAADVDLYVDVNFSALPTTSTIFAHLMARGVGVTGPCYAFGVGMTSAGTLSGRLRKFNSSLVATELQTATAFNGHGVYNPSTFPGQVLRLRMQVRTVPTGAEVRGKMWLPHYPEPQGWMMSAIDDGSVTAVLAAGDVGVLTSTGGTLAPLTISVGFDNFRVV